MARTLIGQPTVHPTHVTGSDEPAVVVVPFREVHETALVGVVERAVRVAFAGCYAPAMIDRLVEFAARGGLARSAAFGTMLVATQADRPVGTASLEGAWIHSVYVAPDRWGRGIGRALMAALEREARSSGRVEARLLASLPSEGFYQRVGYRTIDAHDLGVGRMIEMAKDLRT
ncbi:MAG: GNAT family N-acetyltransferase [Isosphaeraceae bacterium]